MEPRTDSVTTQDWLEAMKGHELGAYIEVSVPTADAHVLIFHEENHDILREHSVMVTTESDIAETEVWDRLSDDALLALEQEMDE